MRCREGGCGRLLHTVNSTSQCLLVSPVFGTLSSLHPTFIFNDFYTCLTNFFCTAQGHRSSILYEHACTHHCVGQPETPVEIVASPSDESLRTKGLNVIEN